MKFKSRERNRVSANRSPHLGSIPQIRKECARKSFIKTTLGLKSSHKKTLQISYPCKQFRMNIFHTGYGGEGVDSNTNETVPRRIGHFASFSTIIDLVPIP